MCIIGLWCTWFGLLNIFARKTKSFSDIFWHAQRPRFQYFVRRHWDITLWWMYLNVPIYLSAWIKAVSWLTPQGAFMSVKAVRPLYVLPWDQTQHTVRTVLQWRTLVTSFLSLLLRLSRRSLWRSAALRWLQLLTLQCVFLWFKLFHFSLDLLWFHGLFLLGLFLRFLFGPLLRLWASHGACKQVGKKKKKTVSTCISSLLSNGWYEGDLWILFLWVRQLTFLDTRRHQKQICMRAAKCYVMLRDSRCVSLQFCAVVCGTRYSWKQCQLTKTVQLWCGKLKLWAVRLGSSWHVITYRCKLGKWN